MIVTRGVFADWLGARAENTKSSGAPKLFVRIRISEANGLSLTKGVSRPLSGEVYHAPPSIICHRSVSVVQHQPLCTVYHTFFVFAIENQKNGQFTVFILKKAIYNCNYGGFLYVCEYICSVSLAFTGN